MLNLGDDTNTSLVGSSSYLGNITRFKVDIILNLIVSQIINNGGVNIDKRVWVRDGAGIIGDDHRLSLRPSNFPHYLTKLEFSLLGTNSVSNESSFVVIQNSEIFSNFGDLDNIH